MQSLMLFDPYDWQDLAKRIEWALENRAMLLSRQRLLYDQLERIAARDGGAAAKT
jgi:hypothetical protein